jgi:zinc protease
MLKPFLLAAMICLAAFFATPVYAQQRPPAPRLNFDDYMLDLEDYTLDNGLRVILAKDDSAPVVAVNLTYHVGGANDPEGRSGFAHLFEHMMFYGSAHVKRGEFDKYLTQIGAEFNAYTADDKTVYYTTAPANQLPLVLWLESDRMASLLVDQTAFETERQVVIEEYNQRVANAAYGYAGRRLDVLPFQGYAPYERPTIGNVEELNAATLEDVQNFHNTYYVPNNATLVIVGNIDIAQTKLLVEAYFNRIAPGDPVSPVLEQYPLPGEFPTLRTEENGCLIGHEETIVDPLAELPAVWASVVTTRTGAADYYALALLGRILGEGESSRFQQELVQEGLASFAFANFNDSRLGAAVMQFGVYPKPGDDLSTAYDLLRAQLSKVAAEGVTEAELARAKQQALLSSITSFRGNVADTAEWLQDYALRFGDPSVIPTDIARYGEVTLEDVQRVAQTYLCQRPLNIVQIVKEGEPVQSEYPGRLVDAPAQADNPFASLPPGVINRYAAPASLPASELQVPDFVTFTLDNGLEVIFVEQHKTPQVNLRLYVGGSDTALPADEQGIAEIMAGLLTRGTTTRTADEIAAEIESVGGQISGQSFSEFTGVFASGPATEAALIFDLLADVTLNPTFPAEELTLLRDQLLQAMRLEATNPNTQADRMFRKAIYPGHPYSFYRTLETVNAITVEDLQAFHATYYRPNNSLLVILGDLTRAEAEAQAERIFGDWTPGDLPDYLNYPTVARPETPRIYLIDRPGAEQSTLRLGNLALGPHSPERYALEVANTVLGGSGLASRLNKNLREAKGYTYGVFSGFTRRQDVGTFLVGGDVGVVNTGDAVKEILRELQAIRDTGVLTEELSQAQGMLIGQFTMGIADPASLAGELATRHLYGIPLAEIERYAEIIEAVTNSEVISAARTSIDLHAPVIVVVGDAAKIQAQLQEIAEVVLVNADGEILETAPATPTGTFFANGASSTVTSTLTTSDTLTTTLLPSATAPITETVRVTNGTHTNGITQTHPITTDQDVDTDTPTTNP